MRKVSKLKRSVILLFMLFTFGAFIVAYVALKKKCDDLIKQKVIAEEELKDQKTIKNNLFAAYQNLTSEDRIVSLAFHELGMTIADPPISVISIDSEKVRNLQTFLQAQHD